MGVTAQKERGGVMDATSVAPQARDARFGRRLTARREIRSQRIDGTGRRSSHEPESSEIDQR